MAGPLLPGSVGVPPTRAITTTTPLTIGGGASADLSADRTVALAAHGVTYALQSQSPTLTLVGNNTGGTADKADLTVAQVASMIASAVTGALTIGGLFGDGNMGAATFDGSTAVTGCTRSGSVYKAIQDLAFTTATFSNGITLDLSNLTAGFELNCSVSLVGPGSGACRIQCDGNAAAIQVGGVGLTNASPINSISGDGASGIQNAGQGAPNIGTWQVSFKPGVGGAGGADGTGARTGGTGGTAPGTLLLDTGASMVTWQQMRTARTLQNVVITGGGGGGSGGGTTGIASGGGGGSGAAWCRVNARLIVNPGAITVSATGGAGSAGGPGVGSVVGGGGGGGGGYVIVATGSPTTPAITVTAAGGSPGAGTSTGSPGVAGGAGQTRIFNLGAA